MITALGRWPYALPVRLTFVHTPFSTYYIISENIVFSWHYIMSTVFPSLYSCRMHERLHKTKITEMKENKVLDLNSIFLLFKHCYDDY